MKIKYLYLGILSIFYFKKSVAQEIQVNNNSYFTIHLGSFFNLNNKFENYQTIRVLERFNTPGVNAGISYEIEKKHVTLSGGIKYRLIPFGYQYTIYDEQTNTNFNNSQFYRRSEYFNKMSSLPLKIGYQTLENKAKQRFWFNFGLEPNFSSKSSYNYSGPYVQFNTYTKNKTFLFYNLGVGITKIQQNGHQLKFGLNLNVNTSSTAYILGDYTVSLKDRTISGIFLSSATNVGMDFSYAFKKKKK